MGQLSDAVLQGIQIVVDASLAKLKYDKTIEAEIVRVEDLDTGEYKVLYQGSSFSAFSIDPETQFAVGEVVQVVVPEGDLSNRKTIITSVSNNSLSYREMTELMNTIQKVSPNFKDIYGYQDKEYGIVAGKHQTQTIYSASSSQYQGLFQQYLQDYNLIQIEASFRTELHDSHTHGNYGLILEFFSIDPSQTISFTFDFNSFLGDPYKYTIAAPQSAIIQLQPDQLAGLKSIKFFETGFDYDTIPTVSSGKVVKQQNKTISNLFVSDIGIYFVERRDLSDSAYYLVIDTPKGNSIISSISSLDLVARINYRGENVLSSSNTVCRWFERDLSVVTGSDNYDQDAGVGWLELKENTSSTLSLTSSDIGHDKRYKLIAIYGNNTVLVAEEHVYNKLLDGVYDYAIKQDTTANNITLQVINSVDNAALTADWYVSYPDGSYFAATAYQQTKNPFPVKEYLLHQTVTFYCTVYDKNNHVLGTLEHTIKANDSDDDISVSYIGEDVFRYDANGDIAIEDAEKERTLQTKITWTDGVGENYDVGWYILNPTSGEAVTQITSSPQNPDDSMMSNVWMDAKGILHYRIRPKYRFTFNNNSVILKITTKSKGKTYEFVKDLLFLKDGDQGTNGTSYVAVIRPMSGTGYQPLTYKNGSWNFLQLKCYVYKDGERIDTNSNYSISYEWEGSDVVITGSNDRRSVTGAREVNIGSVSEDLQAFVKVQVSIVDPTNSRTTTLYVSYPIDIVVGNLNISDIEIESIPSFVKYTSSGVNPQFYNNNVWFKYAGKEYQIETLSPHTIKLEVNKNDGYTYLSPAGSFIYDRVDGANGESNIGVLRCMVDSNRFVIHPIVMYLDTYGNEAINGWDGMSVKINEEDGYIFAPQIGAGTKEGTDNSFTGVVMGKDSGQDKIGLYGYKAGATTFGLMENGTMFMGPQSGGGRIWMDGTSAVIAGGRDILFGLNGSITNYPNGVENGLILTLAKRENSDWAIQVGQNAFAVNYQGDMVAQNAKIIGEVQASSGRIGGTERDSKGWTITSDAISSDQVTLYSGNDLSYGAYDGTFFASPYFYDFSNDQDKICIVGKRESTGKYWCFDGTKKWVENSQEDFISKLLASNFLTGVKDGDYFLASPSSAYKLVNGKWVEQKALTSLGSLVYSYEYSKDSEVYNISRFNYDDLLQTIVDKKIIGFYRIYAGTTKDKPSSAKFYVTNLGRMYANDVEIQGTIRAKTGYIGYTNSNNRGWTIEANRLFSGSANNHIELRSNGYKDTDGQTLVLWAGGSDPENAQSKLADFRVTQAGKLYASGAQISGTIIVGSKSKIGKLEVTEDGLKSAYYDEDGNEVTLVTYTDKGISNDYIYLTDKGIFVKEDQLLDNNGKITSGEMTISEGVLEGGKITQTNPLTSGTFTLSNGSLITKASDGTTITLNSGQFFTNIGNDKTQVKITGTGLATKQYFARGLSYIVIDNDKGIVIYNAEKNIDSAGRSIDKNKHLVDSEGYLITSTGSRITNGDGVPMVGTFDTEAVFEANTQGDLKLKGYITATGGTLGNWAINKNQNYRLESQISVELLDENGNKVAGRTSEIYLDGNPLTTSTNKAVLYIGTTDTTISEDDKTNTTTKKGIFFVDQDGVMHATGADISGQIKSSAGEIGKWKIEANRLWIGSSSSTHVELNSSSDTTGSQKVIFPGRTFSEDARIWAGGTIAKEAEFYVTAGGRLKATDAYLTGTVYAKTGRIGCVDDGSQGWEISENQISGNKVIGTKTYYAAMSISGYYAFYAGSEGNKDTGNKAISNPAYNAPFSVQFDGTLKATQATIAGNITANSGTIGNWTINTNNNGALSSTLIDSGASTRIYLNGKPSTPTGKVIEVSSSHTIPDTDNGQTTSYGQFYVTAEGLLYAKNATITGTIQSKNGTIGGWAIGDSRLYAASGGRVGMASTGVEATIPSETTTKRLVFWSGAGYMTSRGQSYVISYRSTILNRMSKFSYLEEYGRNLSHQDLFNILSNFFGAGVNLSTNLTPAKYKALEIVLGESSDIIKHEVELITGYALYNRTISMGYGDTVIDLSAVKTNLGKLLSVSTSSISDTDAVVMNQVLLEAGQPMFYADSSQLTGAKNKLTNKGYDLTALLNDAVSKYRTYRASSTTTNQQNYEAARAALSTAFTKSNVDVQKVTVSATTTNPISWYDYGSGVLELPSGNSYFGVTTDGKLYCREAEVAGSITATSLTLSSRYGNRTLISGDKFEMGALDENGNPKGAYLSFNLSTGRLEISGTITASADTTITWKQIEDADENKVIAGASEDSSDALKILNNIIYGNKLSEAQVKKLGSIGTTFISGKEIQTPVIKSGELYSATIAGATITGTVSISAPTITGGTITGTTEIVAPTIKGGTLSTNDLKVTSGIQFGYARLSGDSDTLVVSSNYGVYFLDTPLIFTHSSGIRAWGTASQRPSFPRKGQVYFQTS